LAVTKVASKASVKVEHSVA
jgi:hypothetical protein